MNSFFMGLFVLVAAVPAQKLIAAQIHVAVAANFKAAMLELQQEYEKQSSHHLLLSFASSGKLYAQIVHGAPYQIFFSADTEKPQKLENENLIVAGSRQTYATGQLVLWSPKIQFKFKGSQKNIRFDFKSLAIANPKIAPYGHAAQQTLVALKKWQDYKNRVLRAENIAQTLHFVTTGHVDAAFLAYSQVIKNTKMSRINWLLVPQNLYKKLEQQLVVLRETAATDDFLRFLQSKKALIIIESWGYSRGEK